MQSVLNQRARSTTGVDVGLTGLAGGIGGAIGFDALAHDSEDYLADDLRTLRKDAQALPPELQQAMVNTVGAVNGEPRMWVLAALAGSPPEQILAAVPDAPKEFKQLIKRTAELAAGAPEAAAVIGQMGARMVALEGDINHAGHVPSVISKAVDEGTAGHSPLPAILGGAGLGTGAALLHHLMAKRAAAAG